MDYNHILFTKENGIATITINRPAALNALNEAVLDELAAATEEIRIDKGIQVVILTGAGEKAFVAGADITAMQAMNATEAYLFSRKGQQVFSNIEQLQKPVIAAVDGFALGGGCELAMSCDIRIATEKSKLGQPESGLGVIPGFGGTQRLPRLVGKAIAKELLYTCDTISAQEAKAYGLVNHVAADKASMMNLSKIIAEKIMKKSAIAVSFCKKAVNEGMEMELTKAMEHEAALFAIGFDTQDQVEGMTAFIEKRKPHFTDAL